MGRTEPIMGTVLRAIAIAMAVASIVLSYAGKAPLETTVIPLLAIGLFALALAGFLRTKTD